MSENERQETLIEARDNNGIVIGWVDQAEPDTLIAERSSEELEAEYADLVDRIEPINPAYASICECLASYSQDVIDRLEFEASDAAWERQHADELLAARLVNRLRWR